LSYGRGLSCLFSGPPGTGKTMMAGLIAKSLGRQLWRVDVSRLVSKWIGETEKNLAKIFEEARRAQVVLLFDEADSLFAKRTQVKSSHDRNANMEVNFLLQKMENHDGVTILTTNMLNSIDEAFLRRIRFRVTFPVPDPALRALLWERMLPSRAPVCDDIQFEVLGTQFEMSGGHIRNAVLRGAFAAASSGTHIGHTHLFDAAVAEAREMGRLVRS
jgi:SpoVK/Ycf46/Vps4 family AAA+-type ATPase